MNSSTFSIAKEESLKIQCPNNKSRLFATNNLTNLQFCQLLKSRHDLLMENQIKHKEIVSLKPSFSYQLYRIKEELPINKAFCKELLSRQIQRLEDDRSKLNLELSKIKIKDEQKNFDKQNMITKEASNFKLLKEIWKKDGKKKYQGAEEYVEELNRIIGHVKGNIHSLIKFQSNNDKDFQETYIKTYQLLHAKSKQCQRCKGHSTKIEMLQQKIQQISQKCENIMHKNIEYIQQMSAKDDTIKKLTKNTIKQQTDLKNKIILLEQELLQKDHTVKKFKKDILQLTQYKFTNQIENYDLIIRTSETDLSKFNKSININLSSLLHFITEDLSEANYLDSKNSLSLCQIPLGNSALTKLYSRDYNISQISHINDNSSVLSNSYSQSRIQISRIDYRKNPFNQQTKLTLEENEGSNKRYVRTSNHRIFRPVSSQNDENEINVSAFSIPTVKQ